MRKQQTIQRAVTFTGDGIHSGKQVTMAWKPAPVDHGIKFVRTDLEPRVIIESAIQQLGDATRGITLGAGAVLVHHAEHVLAAVAALRIDNLLIELGGDEVPAMAGGALAFVKLAQEAGIQPQDAKAVPPAAPVAPSPTGLGEMPLDIMKVMNILPHRYPFLMVDRVLKIEEGKITALKNVTINEPFFQGHFPGHPIMPGVLQVEAMAQVAGILMLQGGGDAANKVAYFMSANEVKWRKPVRPGDQLIIEIEMGKMRGKIGKAKGVCKVAGEVVSEAEVMFAVMDK
jgi:beta-hydroxyacyl-ACP dehydratase FabZ